MQSQAELNATLTTLAGEFLRDPAGYAGLQLFPIFAVAEQASDFPVWPRENDLNIPRDIQHSPGAPFSRSLPKLESDDYVCRDYGHETPVPDSVQKKYANQFNALRSALRRNIGIIRVNHELRVKALVDGANLEEATPTLKWNEPNSDPRADVAAGSEWIRLNSGLRPNLMVISEPVRLVLEVHASIAKFFNATTPGTISLAHIAAFLGVSRIAVASQVINSNREGQSLSPADIWDDTVILAHVNEEQDLLVPTFGRTFAWDTINPEGGIHGKIYRQERIASDVVRAGQHTDEKIVMPHAAYRINDVLAEML